VCYQDANRNILFKIFISEESENISVKEIINLASCIFEHLNKSFYPGPHGTT